MNDLIERALRAEATPGELERLDAWLHDSPDNKRHYAQIARLLEAARALPAAAERAHAPSAAELLAARSAPTSPRARHRVRRENGQNRQARWLPWGIAAAAVLALLLTRGGPTPPTGLTGPMLVRTGPTELSTVQLAHGSVVRLGPDSRLRIIPTADAREVALAGRAFFDIAHVPGRPFRVRTEVGAARVLGTEFEINTERDELELVVVEGRVALSAGGQSVEVAEGEVSGIVGGNILRPRRIADADSVLRWTGTFLVFRATPLRAAVAEVERAYDVSITIADARLADRTVTATFVDQSAVEVLRVLCAIADARCETRPGGATISRW